MSRHDHPHHTIDYIEFRVARTAAPPRRSTWAFGWRFNDYGPEYAGIDGPDGDGKVGGLNTGRAAVPAVAPW